MERGGPSAAGRTWLNSASAEPISDKSREFVGGIARCRAEPAKFYAPTAGQVRVGRDLDHGAAAGGEVVSDPDAVDLRAGAIT